MEGLYPSPFPEPQPELPKTNSGYYETIKKYLQGVLNQLESKSSGDRDEFLLIMGQIKPSSAIDIEIRTQDDFEKYISDFSKAEEGSGLKVYLESLRGEWSEQTLHARKQHKHTQRTIESHFLGQFKGKSVEKTIANSLISLNPKLQNIKFIEAPLIDDLIGAGDIYMTIQLKNELIIFAIDITSSIEKSSVLYKLSKEMGNYPLSLSSIKNNLNIYRIELALNDKAIQLTLNEIKEIVTTATKLLQEELIKYNINPEGIIQNDQRYKNDPRFSKEIDLETFITVFVENTMLRNYKNFLAGLYCLYSIKFILDKLNKELSEDDKEIIKKCSEVIEEQLSLPQSSTFH